MKRTLCLVVAGTLAATSISASAVTYTVTKLADTSDGICDADCSLREAVVAANASADDDVIAFAPAVFGSAQTITLTSGEIAVGNNGTLSINGPGANLLTLDGNNASRIIVNDAATSAISGLRLIRGNSQGLLDSGRGGAIYNAAGNLVLSAVVIDGNASTLGGGGLNTASGGITRIQSSTILNNTATGSGGGLQNFSGCFLTIVDSTISDNTSNGSTGGGGGQLNGTALIVNSTISGNSAPAGSGGGFQSNGSLLEVINSTIANNSSLTNGGGLHRGTTNINGYLRNTIIAGNFGVAASPDVTALDSINSLGNNLIGITGTSTGWIASDLLDQNAMLGLLVNNGGSTFTHALTIGSPAIDAGDDCVLARTCASNNAPFNIATDQRGWLRPAGPSLDIGAFEFGAINPDVIFANGFDSP